MHVDRALLFIAKERARADPVHSPATEKNAQWEFAVNYASRNQTLIKARINEVKRSSTRRNAPETERSLDYVAN